MDRGGNLDRSQGGQVSPFVFIVSDKLIQTLAMIWAAVPIGFIVFKNLGVQLISIELADHLVYGISFAWPVLGAQYEAVKQLKLWQDAANYALFAFLLSVLIMFSASYIIARFFTCSTKCPSGEFLNQVNQL